MASNSDGSSTAGSGADSKSASQHPSAPEGPDANGEERVTMNERVRPYSLELVRTTSRINPFLSSRPSLDPNNVEQFDARKWVRAVLQHSASSPEKYPRQTSGVSYLDLTVYGSGGGAASYQKDVLNVLSGGPRLAMQWLRQRRSRVPILESFEGIVKSGEMLLVLGRPGSGVSTLLKTIAGETQGLFVDESSHISYQGIPMDTMHQTFRGEVIYQAETDTHFPQLTVGQTLLFAALARTPENRLPGVSRQLYASHLCDVVMAVFGISHTINTRVGDDFVRGVSGGERKRVSIAEAMLNQSPIQCWDNSTRGLDSATALEFVRTLRLSAELAGTTVIAAMYQASQPAYEVFDKVAVLYEGRQIFFGSTGEAKQYFIDLGYHCPERQTTADFLTSITNPAERIVREGAENGAPRTPDDFALAWKMSDHRARLVEDIAASGQEYPHDGVQTEKLLAVRKVQKSTLVKPESPYLLSLPMQIWLCMTRGYQRLVGDMLFFYVTVGGNLGISLVLGSVFYDLPQDASSINSRCVLLFFAILFNALNSALEVLALFSQRPVVEKHRRYALYHPVAEAISSTICDLPCKILSSLFFNIPIYFMAQLRQEAGHFFIFLLIGFSCTLTMSMIFRTIAQLSRTIHQALTPVALFIVILVIYTGFILPTRDMMGWLRWLNYLDPVAYAYEGLVANEFSGRQFPCVQFVPPYPDAGPLERTCATAGAAPGADFVDGDFFISASYGYAKSHIWRNFGVLWAYIVFFFGVYLLAAEFISTDHSKGEVLVFRRKDAMTLNGLGKQSDEESRMSGRRGGNLTPKQTSTVVGQRQTQLSERKDVVHWRGVCYDIDIKGERRRILDHVDGWVQPGSVTALMGVTGAGKTTLLDVLAGRVSVGVVSGDILVNGLTRDQSFQRKTGYVQQQDIHLSTSTVRESLQFSANLRQSAQSTQEERDAWVEHVIGLLEMEAYADAIVGVPGEGLNVEQRKRLTIGVELAAKPDLLLFLDEPTSGLDSQTAWSIATLIRNISASGQAILCTIHQPSAVLFEQFDRLLLLAKGGKTIYFGDIGENSKTLTAYFESRGATPCGKDENPAEWMLEVIGAAPGAKAGRDWVQAWKVSDEYAGVQRRLEELQQRSSESTSESGDKVNSSTFAAPTRVQLAACTKRAFQQYWRTPSYIYSKMILSGGTSLIIGLSFQQAPLSMQGLQSQMFATFILLVSFAFLVYQTMPHFILQRELYEARERASRTYSWQVFMSVNIIVELPWNTLVALLIFFPYYYIVGMDKGSEPTTERGALMFLLVWVFMMFESTFADMVVAGAPTAEVGATIALLLFALCLIFCGVMVPLDGLPGFWKFMYRVSPLTYLVGGMLSVGLAQKTIECSELEILHFATPQGGNLTCGEYLAPYQEMAGTGSVLNPSSMTTCRFCPLTQTDAFLAGSDIHYDQKWRNFGLMWAYVAFNLFAALFLYWIVRVPKVGLRQRLLSALRVGDRGPKSG
ncbi:probable ABC1 transport protein [Cephalotrichum gorgonifer]|uniref:Probable ABC1 transport protein n=1 Tax=Cephalotrichum gorgonifer TaxID=2041049 RepID=A0AAE8SXB2_9PEZI|nr:probable ABC1 transport protein [Cephalotrichum gorgonifer]